MMTIIILDSIAVAAIIALLITIIIEGQHDSEISTNYYNDKKENNMKDVHYYICEGIDKKKTYIAISKEDISTEAPARKFANNKYFKLSSKDADEILESTIGYISNGNLYFGLMPANIKGEKVWMISRRDKKKENK